MTKIVMHRFVDLGQKCIAANAVSFLRGAIAVFISNLPGFSVSVMVVLMERAG